MRKSLVSKLNLVPIAAFSCFAGKVAAQTFNTQPNIIYIMSDDHARQAISAYGSVVSKLAPTPNIDRIAREGVRFENAFVENSLSTPSRACLMTGLYSHQNGQRQLGEGIDSTKTFFSELLQKAGYTTGVVGKWHMKCTPKGFDYYHILQDQGTYYNPVFRSQDSKGAYIREEGYVTSLITQHAIEFLEHRDKSKPFVLLIHHKAPHRNWLPDIKNFGLYNRINFPLPKTFYDDYATRGSAVRTQKMRIDRDMILSQDLKVDTLGTDFKDLITEWDRLTNDQREAFETYYGPRNKAFQKAHLRGDSLVIWKYENYLRDYLNVIHSVDESVGEIYDYLKKNGLLDNTIIVYTSDNGFYLGEHGWFDKRFMYEESLHIPLIVRYPKTIKLGSVDHIHMVQNIDFAPTFLSIAGVKKPSYMPGTSLTRLFANQPYLNWRKSIYYHYYDYPTVHMVRKHDGIRTDRYKLIHFYGKGGARAQQENKYQRIPGTDEYRNFQYLLSTGYISNDSDVNYNELYDLKKDPNELNNLYGKLGYQSVTKELWKELNKYRKDLKVDEY